MTVAPAPATTAPTVPSAIASPADLDALAGELAAIVGATEVRRAPSELHLYRHDASNMEGRAAIVCFPHSTAEVAACVRATARHGVPFVARGSGTGLAGGAVPPDGAVVIALTKMNAIAASTSSTGGRGRAGRGQPRPVPAGGGTGLHFAPTRAASRRARSGNIANNAGGPHCLADGVTSSHVLALEVVLPDGTVCVLGGEEPEPAATTCVALVGSEGVRGVATRCACG